MEADATFYKPQFVRLTTVENEVLFVDFGRVTSIVKGEEGTYVFVEDGCTLIVLESPESCIDAYKNR